MNNIVELHPKGPLHATFKASYLAALFPLVEYCRAQNGGYRFHNGEIFIEPHVDGGCIITAFADGHGLAKLYDATGTCSEGFAVSIPDEAFEICGKTKYNKSLDIDGTEYNLEIPEFLQVGDVCLTESGMCVSSKMPDPKHIGFDGELSIFYTRGRSHSENNHKIGIDYSTSKKLIIKNTKEPFIKYLKEGCESESGTFNFDCKVAGLYDKIKNLIYENAVFEYKFTKSEDADSYSGPIFVYSKDIPYFIGVFMPQRSKDGFNPPNFWKNENSI